MEGVEDVGVDAVQSHVADVGVGVVGTEEDVGHSAFALDVAGAFEAHAGGGAEAAEDAHALVVGVPVVIFVFVDEVGDAVAVLGGVHSVDEEVWGFDDVGI